jgi:hypothetical protein
MWLGHMNSEAINLALSKKTLAKNSEGIKYE